MSSPELRFQAGAARANLAHAIAAADRAQRAAANRDEDIAAAWLQVRVELEAIGRRVAQLHNAASFRSESSTPDPAA